MISSFSKNTSSSHIIVARVNCPIFLNVNYFNLMHALAAAMIPYSNLYRQGSLPNPECILVVDSGFSYTHVVPMVNGSIVWKAVKR